MGEPVNIVVMSGGQGPEREVSLRSGVAVTRALRGLGHRVTELDPIDDTWTLPAGTQMVFLALHGVYGEDGQVQRQLQLLGMPYTGSGPKASELAFDKARTKKVLREADLPTPDWTVIDAKDAPWPTGWEAPLVLKPVEQGSSVGLQFVDSRDQWTEALMDAWVGGGPLLCEPRVVGREITVGILNGEALPVVEVRPRRGAYDYHNKYTVGATEYFCPADFSAEETRKLQRISLAAFRAVGARDFGRVDLMVDPQSGPALLEVNTLPGLTETSLLPKAAAAAGLDFAGLCQRMLELARRRAAALAA